jgi:hypothetical protein
MSTTGNDKSAKIATPCDIRESAIPKAVSRLVCTLRSLHTGWHRQANRLCHNSKIDVVSPVSSTKSRVEEAEMPIVAQPGSSAMVLCPYEPAIPKACGLEAATRIFPGLVTHPKHIKVCREVVLVSVWQ